ncbi:hypothetical protein F9B85_11755 [Heliorestis acidaminivorans]|uniref:Stage II sporulation protein M n=1 Tax=Heliorestis acidaminivorans TaxID=553427 RepID=A0A6I0EP81_9FIRM|nr:stage II sporulation protein M [Heliorestis acidaminivorans]KAB2951697.1 hypothetical protein F9B85_11755 [Heliorestis acidaminivorans]
MYQAIKMLTQHLNLHWTFFGAVLFMMALGVATGAYGASTLPAEQLELLNETIGRAFLSIQSGIDSHALAQLAVSRNVLIIGLVLFLGLTILGIPIIIALLFYRTFVLGFTVTFLLQTRSDGILVILLSLLPSSIILIPALAVAGIIALAFSFWLIRGRREGTISLNKALVFYFAVSLACLLMAIVAGLVDAYIAPFLLRFFLL